MNIRTISESDLRRVITPQVAVDTILDLGTATVSILGWDRENPVIETWNEACHLA